LAATALAAPKWHELSNTNYGFEDFVHEFGLQTSNETEEYWVRKEIFEHNVERIMEHNRNPTKSWKLGVNKFAASTEAEMQKMMGYNKPQGFFNVAQQSNALPSKPVNVSALPDRVDWREKGAVTPVKDQGGCGSCWTFAAAETIESHYFLKTGKLVELSEQQIASCTSNPKHCGGTGGCAGGTAQVAYDSIVAMGGIESQWTNPYISYQGNDQPCTFNKARAAVQLSKYVQLPNNEYEPLMEAVANVGPIAISVDASAWSFYESGIFDGCNQTTPDVDHAVQLVGYGSENGQDYWLVRNSWSPNWGENGYIRLRRSTALRCGTDVTPEHGSGCDGGPKTVQACGTCSILFDSCYPVIA